MPVGSHHRRLAVLERDAALARVGRTRRWAIAATAALTAGFAALVSALAPGRSLGAKGGAPSTPSTTATGPSASTLPPLEGPGQLGLQGPNAAPAAAPPPPAPPSGQPSAPSTQPQNPAPAGNTGAAPANTGAGAAGSSNAAPPATGSGGGGPVVSGGS